MDDLLLNTLLTINNLAELKVVLYIRQHTQETPKRITTNEFIDGAKLSKPSVIKGLYDAERHGFIECTQDNSNKTDIKKYYKLKTTNFGESVETPKPKKQIIRKPIKKSRPSIKKKILPKKKNYVAHADYLQSRQWMIKREKALRFAGYRCQICNSPNNLQVHHRTYERIGNERLGDLTVLCADCHDTFTFNGELHRFETQDKQTGNGPYESIWKVIEEISRGLGDEEHIPSNRIQACNIYDDSNMDEKTFMKTISTSKDKAERANIRKINKRGEVNRMPYFFQCLRKDCLDL